MRIALGTAQLGMPYGIANTAGLLKLAEARSIVQAAEDSGIRWFDTATGYGKAEEILGESLLGWRADEPPCIATKLALTKDSVNATITASLQRLRKTSLEAVLLHDENDLARFGTEAYDEFLRLKKAGLAESLGVSCYEPMRAAEGLEAGLDCLQVPANLFDQRFMENRIIERARDEGVRVFVRSIFLQGLFFLQPDDPRAGVAPGASEALRLLHDFCQKHSVTPGSLALAYGAMLPDAIILIGVESASQVRLNAIEASQSHQHLELVDRWLHQLPQGLAQVADPRSWVKPAFTS